MDQEIWPVLQAVTFVYAILCLIFCIRWLKERHVRQAKQARAYALHYLPPAKERIFVPVNKEEEENDSFPDFWYSLEHELDQELSRDEALWYFLLEPMRQLYELYPDQEQQISEPLDPGLERANTRYGVMAVAELMLHDSYVPPDEDEVEEEEDAS